MISSVTERIVAPFRRHPFVSDAVLAVVLFVLSLAVSDVGYETGSIYPWADLPRYWISVVTLAVTMLPVATRRRFPFSSLLVSVAGLAALRLLHVPEYQLSSIVLFFLMYSTGRWGAAQWRDHVRWGAAAAVVVILLIGLNEERKSLSLGFISTRSYILASIVGILGNLVFIVGPWILGNVARSRAERESELAEANAELVDSRLVAEQQAVTAERVRIARELHDVVAHHVSVMGVQAGAARRMLEVSPDQASDALADIEKSSREAVAELHRLLGFLRSPEPTHPAADVVDTPAPGLDRLDELRRQTAAAGLAVSLSILGDRPSTLPASVDLSAFRIVQEGLTNALKHSGEREAAVIVEYRARSLHVTIRNAGPTVSASARSGGGNGLVGMQERVALHGGTLDVGPLPSGGFVVEAELPYDRAPQQIAESVA